MSGDDERLTAIRAEAENVHESAQLASETQFEYAKSWRTVDRWTGTIAAALAAVAGVGGLSRLLPPAWAGGIAVAAALAGAISASVAARRTTERAAVSANLYRALQQDTRMFLRIDLAALPVEDARARLQRLVDRLQQLNRESEIPSPKAWKRAKGQIEAGSQTYASERHP